jgi:uncharacterized protein
MEKICVTLRCYAELAGFLPAAKRQTSFAVSLRERDSVKDVIEAQGVPHTEVDLVLVNGEPVHFSYRVQDGDRIAAYPAFRSIALDGVPRAGPPPLAEPRFVLDVHLGTLASLLRLLGFDVLYRNDYDDPTLARIGHDEQRILLTRDRGLLKRSLVTYGYHVWATDPERQLEEVLARFNLHGAIAPFSRCLRCNSRLEPVPKAEIVDRLEPKTKRYYDEFAICRACDRIFWKGSHHDHMHRIVERVWAAPEPASAS